MGTKEFSPFKHLIIPILGVITNVGLALGIFVLNFQAGGTAAQEVGIALAIAGGWLLVSVIFFLVNSRQRNVPIIPTVSTATGAGD